MQRMKKIKFWMCFLKVILVISILPLFCIALYNHSTSDDFSYGWMPRVAWVDTHNLWEVLRAVLMNVKETYFTWQGSYSAIAVFALQPGIWGENFYFVTTFIILGLFLFSYFYFFKRICRDILQCNNQIGTVVACVVLLISVQLSPSPAEAFFWWNGASYYVVFHSLMLIFLVNLIVYICRGQCSLIQWTGLNLLGIFIAGGNYITMLLALEVSGCAVIFSVCKRNAVSRKMICTFFLMLAGFLVNCMSPGNAVRQSAYEAWSPLKAVLYSYHEAYLHMEKWTEPILVIALFFLLPFLWRTIDKMPAIKLRWYLLLLFIMFSIFASSFTPTLYAYGEVGPGRIQNIRYFLWILTCIIFEEIFLGMMKSMVVQFDAAQMVLHFLEVVYNKYAVYFYGIVLVCVVFFCINYTFAEGREDFTTVSAVKSLVWGEARQYDREVRERIKLLEGNEKIVYISSYSSHPRLLFLIDIQEDSDNWINCAVAKFYKKESVCLKE